MRARLPFVALAGAAGFVLACALVRGGLLRPEQFGDVRLYELYARRIVDGEFPYRDFFFEYPPGSLVVFLLPAVSLAHYTVLFKTLMALCGAALVPLAAHAGRQLGYGHGRTAAVVAALALAPLALGPIVLDEFDLWPTLITLSALVALLAGRHRLGGGLLGFGAATKIFPVAILPAALVWIHRRAGARAARNALLAFAGVAAASYAVFVAFGAGGVWYSFLVQARRGLQKESLGSALLLALDQLGLYKARIVVGNPHWTELTGPAGDTLALLSTVAQALVALAVAAIAARRRPDPSTLVLAAAAAVAGFVAFGKVLSPQYLIWLVPLVLLAAGIVETALLATALVLTQLWFLDIVRPFDLHAQVWLFVARDAILLALFGLLLVRLRRLVLAVPARAGRRATREPGFSRAGPT